MSELGPHTEADLIERLHAIDARAPEELHRRVHALVAERDPEAYRRDGAGRLTRWLPARGLLVAATAVAAVTVVLALALSGGDSSRLTVRKVAATTLLAAKMGAPSENPNERSTLAESVDGVAFPYWKGHFGWRASGARSDTIDGRTVNTVFYADASGQRIGYAIVAGRQAHPAFGGKLVRRQGKPYWLLDEHGVISVVWLRSGHLCVVAGRGVSSSTLLALASWHERASAS